jgi:flagellar hook-associated protein 3 FlgL
MAILPLQIARVSNAMRLNTASSSLTRTQAQLLRVQNELTTGKRLNTPSDAPGDAAVAQQLRKTLEQRKAYLGNMTQATTQLSAVDSTLGDVNKLLTQAQQIASANVGSTVTADERAGAAEVVKSIMSQMISLGNKQSEGMYLFAGDKSNAAPFVEQGGGVKFVGTTNALTNSYDESTVLPFTVSGDDVFGALSTRVTGTANLTPAVQPSTRLSDLNGATGNGVRPGSILISNGTTSATVDLSKAADLQDTVRTINASGVGVTASIAPDGVSLLLTPGAGTDTLSVNEVGGGTTAADLGILQKTALPAGAPLDGADVKAKVTGFTLLSDLKGGAGIDVTGGLRITNGLTTVNVAVPSSPTATVQDLLNAINASGTFVRAEINATADGINVLNPTSGASMTIGENGGTTATDLGVRSFAASTVLADLNGGKGVGSVSGADFQITRRDGTSFTVDLTTEATIQDVINTINTAAGSTMASLATNGNGIVLTDSSAGAGTFAVTAQNFSNAARDLGIDTPASGATITGKDTNPVTASGIFSNLARLRDALLNNDQTSITAAAEGLKGDGDRVARINGLTGARVQEMENRSSRLEDENVTTQSLLTNLEASDYNEAISRFQLLQTSLQASLATSGKILTQSLMDFLS